MTASKSDDLSPAWIYPVQITMRVGPPEFIENSKQALECLMERWPKQTGRYFDAAMSKCNDGGGTLVSAQDARDSFISAAIDAHILGY